MFEDLVGGVLVLMPHTVLVGDLVAGGYGRECGGWEGKREGV